MFDVHCPIIYLIILTHRDDFNEGCILLTSERQLEFRIVQKCIALRYLTSLFEGALV